MKFCTKCGTPVSEDSRFCTKCGQPVYNHTEQNKKSGYTLNAEQMKKENSQERMKTRSQNQVKKETQPQNQVKKKTQSQNQRQTANHSQQKEISPKPPKKNTGLVVGIVAAVLVLSIGIGVTAAVLVKRGSDSEVVQKAETYVAQPLESTSETTAETTQKIAETKESKEETVNETKSASQAANETKTGTGNNNTTNSSPYPGQKFPYSSQQYLSSSDLAGMTRDEIQLSINDIYARHGYIFKDDSLRAYYQSQSWYHGTNSDMNAVAATFNSIEKANVELLSNYAR